MFDKGYASISGEVFELMKIRKYKLAIKELDVLISLLSEDRDNIKALAKKRNENDY